MSPVASLHFPFAPRGSMDGVGEAKKSAIHLSATPEECDDVPPESRPSVWSIIVNAWARRGKAAGWRAGAA
jgi:hypothetical protein